MPIFEWDAASNAHISVLADSPLSTPPLQPQSDMEEAYPLLLAASAMVTPTPPVPTLPSSQHLANAQWNHMCNIS